MNKFLVLSLFLVYVSGFPDGFLHINNDKRIAGGHDISIEEVPYQISLQSNEHHECGGSIVSETYIVTAAHCVEDAHPNNLSIRVGSSIREVGGEVFKVSAIHVHPNYENLDNDIAILKLELPLTFGSFVAPIELPSENQSWPTGTEVLVSGWGLMHDEDTALATNLQGVTVKILDAETCKSLFGPSTITDHMICAGEIGKSKGACNSDSGGPLAVNGVLAGVVSFGDPHCGQVPNVYASVPALRSFIQQVTGL